MHEAKDPAVVVTSAPLSMSRSSDEEPPLSTPLPRWAGRSVHSFDHETYDDYEFYDTSTDGHGRQHSRSSGPWGSGSGPQLTWRQRGRHFVDSFRRDPRITVSHKGIFGAAGRVFDAREAAQQTARTPLSRHLRGRHLQMIAFGGSIGTGLFVGSGKALQNGGPASVLIAFSLIGVMLYGTMHALGELSVAFPVAGSFSAFSTRFLDPAWGFAMGWNYALMWLVVLPLETVAASIVIDYWHTGISNALWVTIVLSIVVTINLFGVKGYGEAEFVLSIIKVVAIVGFIILGVILDIGGGPNGSYLGAKLWYEPGAFHNGFKGLCSVFVTAAFAFGGTELVGLAAAETESPRKTLPQAIKQVFWRVAIFYVVSLFLVGLLVPYTEPRLLGAANANTRSSPFVIAISNAGISGLDSAMNAVIMLAVLSVGNSAVYGSSRTLAALAEQNQAPRAFAYIDRRGRPLVAVLFAATIGLLAYLGAAPQQETAFAWMVALSGLSSVFTWGSICLAHIRFRAAWRAQGHDVRELAFRSHAGVLGSWLGFAINALVLVAQFWVGFAPVAGTASPPEAVEGFFQVYLAAPIVLATYAGYKLYFRTRIVGVHEMDLSTGRRDFGSFGPLWEEGWDGGRPRPARWKQAYRWLC